MRQKTEIRGGEGQVIERGEKRERKLCGCQETQVEEHKKKRPKKEEGGERIE